MFCERCVAELMNRTNDGQDTRDSEGELLHEPAADFDGGDIHFVTAFAARLHIGGTLCGKQVRIA